MFLGGPSSDLKIIIVVLTIVITFAFFIYIKTKKALLTLFLFSIISNSFFYFISDSTFFDVYHLKWLVKFTLWYWPWLNLALLILLILNFLKNKNAKNG